jgi:phosphocarrier protein FPr
MVGIVIVSHSYRLAKGVAELARETAGPEVRIEIAGGLDLPDHPLGTDAVVVQRAIERAWSDDGVLVLMDLGSAVLSAEMALEFLADERRPHVLLCEGPIVEGAVAAAVTANLGSALHDVAAEARAALASKLAHLATELDSEPADGSAIPAAGGDSIQITVENEHGLHARPVARLVQTASTFEADVWVRNRTTGRGPVSARSINGVATLGVVRGHTIEVFAAGPQARAALHAIAALAVRGFDEEALARPDPAHFDERTTTESPPGEHGALRGFAASPGVAVGPARWLRPAPPTVLDRAPRGARSELQSLRAALDATRRDIAEQRTVTARRAGNASAQIFDAHLLFLEDEALIEPARRAIDDGATAERAWTEAVGQLTEMWAQLDDDYLRARAADVESVGRQVLAHLTGEPARPASIEASGVLLSEDLSPAEAAALDPDVVLGVATARGGPTSHAAVLARAVGIPAVVGTGTGLFEIREGVNVELDGEQGTLTIEPSVQATERNAEREVHRRTAAAAARDAALKPAATRDGAVIDVAANIGAPREIAEALAWGADGVGLFRTEFLFLGRDEMPSEDEQAVAYRQAAVDLGGRSLVLRTLDVGADKPLPFLPQPPEENPSLGVRGIRMGLSNPGMLSAQLRAVASVAAEHPLHVMFPMIATVSELRSALEILARARDDVSARGFGPARDDLQVGAMIEVPSAALTAASLAPLVDFVSIGTNDLAQYALAADRGNERVAGLGDAAHPAVLRLIRMSCEAATAAGAWVGVCGEAAGDAMLTPVLLGLGVRELSMQARAIPNVKRAVRSTSLAEARALADEALREPDADAVRRRLIGAAHDGVIRGGSEARAWRRRP